MVSTYSTETTLIKHYISIERRLLAKQKNLNIIGNYYFQRLCILIFQVASSSGGLQRDTSIDVEDEFHRAPESSTEFQTEMEPRTLDRTPEGGIFPRAEEIPRTTEDANAVEKDNVEGGIGNVDPESEMKNGVYPAMDSMEEREKVYPAMESAEDRENREAMEAWEAQRGIEGNHFR